MRIKADYDADGCSACCPHSKMTPLRDADLSQNTTYGDSCRAAAEWLRHGSLTMVWEAPGGSSVGISSTQGERPDHWKSLFDDKPCESLTSLGSRGFGEEEGVIATSFFLAQCPYLLPDWCCRSLERVFSIGSMLRPRTGSLCQCYRSLSHFERGSKSVPRTQRTKPSRSRVRVTTCQHVSQPAKGQTWNTKKASNEGKRGK